MELYLTLASSKSRTHIMPWMPAFAQFLDSCVLLSMLRLLSALVVLSL